jgi:hypothetical protein
MGAGECPITLARTSRNREIDLLYHQWMGVGDDNENLNDFSYDEY